MTKQEWTILSTNGTNVQTVKVQSAHPHFEAIRHLADMPQGARAKVGGVIVMSGSATRTVPSLADPVKAFLSLDYERLSQRLGSKSSLLATKGDLPVAVFMQERCAPHTMRYDLMAENMPWLESFMPSDLAQVFPLVDDDGNLKHHLADLQLLSELVVEDAEAVLASSTVTADARERALLQLQMAAYMQLRPRNLLSLLLNGVMPLGHVSNVLREFTYAQLELY